MLERGQAKLGRKRANMIIANQIGAGDTNTFGSDNAKVCLITHEGAEWLESESKTMVARRIWNRAVEEATR